MEWTAVGILHYFCRLGSISWWGQGTGVDPTQPVALTQNGQCFVYSYLVVSIRMTRQYRGASYAEGNREREERGHCLHTWYYVH